MQHRLGDIGIFDLFFKPRIVLVLCIIVGRFLSDGIRRIADVTVMGFFFCSMTRRELVGNSSEYRLSSENSSSNWNVSVRQIPLKGV